MSNQIKKYIIAESFTILFDPVLKYDEIAKGLPYEISSIGYVTIDLDKTKRIFQVKCWCKNHGQELVHTSIEDKKAIEKFLSLMCI
jgi:hypothetical protein